MSINFTCRTCGVDKPIDAFAKTHANRGHDALCRSCRNEKIKLWKRKKREKLRELFPKRPRKDKHQIATERREYYLVNQARKRAYSREYYHLNKAQVSARRRHYRENNKIHVSEQNRRYRLKNNNWHHQNYIKNKERLLRQSKIYRSQNRHRYKELNAKRRHRRTNQSDGTAPMVYQKIKNSDFAVCYYCKKRFSPEQAHVDHVIPLVRGGSHSDKNLAAACPSCNLRKNSKLPSSFAVNGQPLLNF